MGKQDECFYCGETLGNEHKRGCVLRERTIIIEFKCSLLVSVPEDWGTEMIEFFFNDSSYCSSNLIDELKKLDKHNNCICPFSEVNYLREANKEDEFEYGYRK